MHHIIILTLCTKMGPKNGYIESVSVYNPLYIHFVFVKNLNYFIHRSTSICILSILVFKGACTIVQFSLLLVLKAGFLGGKLIQ